MTKFTETVPAPSPPQGTGVGIGESGYLHELNAGAFNPFLKSVITGIIIWVLAALLFSKFGVDDWLWLSSFIAVAAVAVAWFLFQKQLAHLIGLAEIALNRDFDQSGVVGNGLKRPVEVEETVLINLQFQEKDGTVNHTERHRLPLSPTNLQLLADGLLVQGKGLTEKEWTGKGKPFGDTEWVAIREALLKARYITLRNKAHPNLGYAPTRTGLAVFQHYSSPPAPPQN
jgi:hypothetical protein